MHYEKTRLKIPPKMQFLVQLSGTFFERIYESYAMQSFKQQSFAFPKFSFIFLKISKLKQIKNF